MKKFISGFLIVVMLAAVGLALPEGSLYAPDSVNAAAQSGFELSGANAPVTLKVGQSFSIRGTITSNYNMRYICVGMQDLNGKWINSKIVERAPYTTKFNVANADAQLKFGALGTGAYYYVIYVEDINGAGKILMKRQFTVGNVSSEFNISTLNLPGALTKGEEFAIKGTITSKLQMSRVEVGIVKNGSWMQGHYANKYISDCSFNVAGVNQTVDFSSLPSGTYNYRIWAHDKNGSRKLIDKVFTVKSESDSSFDMTALNVPTVLYPGQSFDIKGTIRSNLAMKQVEIGIIKNDSWVKNHYVYKAVDTKTYDVAQAASQINFADLPVGTYSYRIWTWDANGGHRALDKRFTVEKGVSEFSVASANHGTLEYLNSGEAFQITGTVHSKYPITHLEVGIVNPKDLWEKGQCVSVTPNALSYDLSQASSKLEFSKLPQGTYWYRIWAWDQNGSHRVVDKKFKVTNKSEFNLASLNTPDTITKGKNFTLTGTVKSSYPMTRVEVGIVKGGSYVSGHHINIYPNSRFCPIKQLNFSNLSEGTYSYRVWAHDKNGSHKIVDRNFVVKGKTTTGQNIANYAKTFVGKVPYVWGGSSLKTGIDCGWFTYRVHERYGIYMPDRMNQIKHGRVINYNNALPGDVICYKGHVAIYIGGGKIVHAANPRSGVTISNATYTKIQGVRRYW